MSKQKYMERHGVTLRHVTDADRQVARTDYQRNAEYIMRYAGVEWYSKRATLEDAKALVSYHKASAADYAANGRRATA
jgi:hypothetical protein